MEVGAEMKYAWSNGQRAEQLRELEELVEQARACASRLREIDEQVSLRRQLESGGWPEPGSEKFAAWDATRESVDQFYAEFGEFVERARIVLDGFREWIGSLEVESLQRKLHRSAVRSTCEALERALERAREFGDAEAAGRRRRARGLRAPEDALSARENSSRAESLQTAPRIESGSHSRGKPPSWAPSSWFADEHGAAGRWVTAATYARVAGISIQTLANWRYKDRRAGRKEAQPDKPRYRYFGAAVRYWLPAEMEGGES